MAFAECLNVAEKIMDKDGDANGDMNGTKSFHIGIDQSLGAAD